MNLDGLLIVDKPAGLTSHDVVARARRALKTRRIGHTGTLDPFATGVLVLCINRATRLVQYLTGDDKEYMARMRLGFATDSGDLTGTPLSAPVDAGAITPEGVRTALSHFRGRIEQIPPMHSAKKVGGVKLYEMARRGEQIERAPITIEIKELELIAGANRLSAPADLTGLTRDFTFRVVCSSGTYVRTLAEEIGQRLGIGAHLVGLQRTRAGGCHLPEAVSLDHLAELSEAASIEGLLKPMNAALAMPEIKLDGFEAESARHGREISRAGDWMTGERGKLCREDGELLAVAEYDAERMVWRPRVVLSSGTD
jgi:tRNA pseudouridine55 synthase